MTVVRVGEIELDCERSGQGPPLLLIMGMSGTALSWGEPFLELLRRDFDVIAYDHRGVGASSRLDGPLTIREMAGDAEGLLAALELDSAHVLGISMGGMIAQELALAAPERIRTLTLGCTYCGGEGSQLAAPEALQRTGRGDDVGGPRARAARLVGDQRLTGDGRRRGRVRALRRDRHTPAGGRAGDHGADAGVRRARHPARASGSCGCRRSSSTARSTSCCRSPTAA